MILKLVPNNTSDAPPTMLSAGCKRGRVANLAALLHGPELLALLPAVQTNLRHGKAEHLDGEWVSRSRPQRSRQGNMGAAAK